MSHEVRTARFDETEWQGPLPTAESNLLGLDVTYNGKVVGKVVGHAVRYGTKATSVDVTMAVNAGCPAHSRLLADTLRREA